MAFAPPPKDYAAIGTVRCLLFILLGIKDLQKVKIKLVHRRQT